MEDKEISPKARKDLNEGRRASVTSNLIRSAGADELKEGLKDATVDELNALDFEKDIPDATAVAAVIPTVTTAVLTELNIKGNGA